MPALDFINKTADTVADISAGSTLATTAVENSRAGFNVGEGFTVVVGAASAANFDTDVTRELRFYLDVSLDNGTSYYPIGVTNGIIGATGVPLQVRWGSCEYDIIPENYTAANIQWRGRADWTNALASTDDFNFQFFLGNRNIGIPGLLGTGVA